MSQANAWSGDWNGPGGGGAGDITFSSNTTGAWDLTIIDTKKDGHCAQVRLAIDRPGWSDYDISWGPKACGYQQGVHWKDSHSTSGGTKMRSIKIQQCRLHSDNSDKKCEEVKRVYNPKY
ncbi:hypothetical protein [Streptomyces chartreusis]|uniref:Uncharacterized protein n=1 Tax=Streptomyces chartreusis TaxID=1969 RepID=A0A7H8T5X4_STRCX|nr:hypothetical protein [Streptomyces chartreusis]QKZ18368.1 hypothetical protein HUT05_13950 [Streptomyces chartreusis]